MAYPTNDDLTFAAGGMARLIQATDWNNTTQLDQSVLDQAVAMADGTVNSYLKKFFAVPIADPPIEVRGVSARIALFKMRAGRGMAGEAEIKQHETDMAWLKGVADGEITLGIATTPIPSPMRVDAVTPRPAWKKVSREKLNGFR